MPFCGITGSTSARKITWENSERHRVDDAGKKLLARLPALAAGWRAGECDAALFAARYFIVWQMAIHGRHFASRKRKNDPRPEAEAWLSLLEAEGEAPRARLLSGLERYQFRGVIGNVPVVLARWLRGSWPLVLRAGIPAPREILRMQARGRRAVTALTAWPRMCRPVLHKPDAFAFFVHDLEHAYKFFHSPALHAEQRAFFARLERACDRGVFAPYLEDPPFVEKFHYLMSDMNTHPEHGRQYLRAILVEFYLRRGGKVLSEPLSAAAEWAVVEVLRGVCGPMPSGDADPDRHPPAAPSRRARSPTPLAPDLA